MLKVFTDSDWLENFCVSRATFLYLCSELELGIAKKCTQFRMPISVQKRVAIDYTLGIGNHSRVPYSCSSFWCCPLYCILYCAGDLQVNSSHFTTKVYSVSS